MTTNEILTTICKMMANTPLIAALSGGIYKTTRPNNSNLEDAVVSLISGTTAKHLQSGALYIKLFYADLLENSTYFENTTRSEYMEKLLFDFSNVLLQNNVYSFEISSREIYSESIQELHQHYSILKINFQI